ncbi:hypothetical protein BKA70DRAFT_1134642 [Coprinopsis sp. MPI-PUGE-AT-0042]|nr:hypothetical protein BKA70DRAFT_1134642 [Coprinopsis sp. MPI-PUGE-AT-0042]
MESILTCDACHKGGLSYTGYWSHLQQSKRPECRALHLALQEASLDREAALDSDSESSSSSDSDVESFMGDFFGSPMDYMEDSFGQDHFDDEESSENDDDEEAVRLDNLDQENGWEPQRPSCTYDLDLDPESEEDDAAVTLDPPPSASPHVKVAYSSVYPNQCAGKPTSQTLDTDTLYRNALADKQGPFYPFASQRDWEVAKWAKLRGPGSTAFSELLKIGGVHEALGLSYKTTAELNKIIDDKLPARPQFKRREIVVGGEAVEMYSRDIVECIRALWANPEFASVLAVEPERHYADADQTIRVIHEMHTAKWWWETQKAVEKETKKKNITIIAIIISTDKTQLTTFRNKTAYPPSRQAQILLGYLPTSKLEHITNKSARRRCLANLFHACMSVILRPLERSGVDGLMVTDGAGVVRRGHPVLAAYIGDYPEQVLVTGVKTTDCPTCPTSRDELGNPGVRRPRDLDPILDALESIHEGATAFRKNCTEAGVKPIQQPFWLNLPFVHIHRSITPDILHQLYQGVIKHLLGWLKDICGADELDARCRRLPPNHHIRIFFKGISTLSRVTGTEHDQITRFILGIILDIKLPHNLSNARLLNAVRALLDFLYLSKYPVHTTETLDQMEESLNAFHNNKDVFIQLGVRSNFNLPKLHFLGHYRELFEIFGTGDNFNTEYTERLHIDMAKDAYRATNSKDEYPQMAAWLDRKERVLLHDKFLKRRLEAGAKAAAPDGPPSLLPVRRLRMASSPSVSVPFGVLKEAYGADNFEFALSKFIVHFNEPSLPKREVARRASNLRLPFQKVPVYHRIKFVASDVFAADPSAEAVVDSIHVEPPRRESLRGSILPGRFDTALIKVDDGPCDSIAAYYCVGRIRCVFSLPAAAKECFPGRTPPSHLCYVELFTPFAKVTGGRHHRLYQIARLMQGNTARVTVIPLTLVKASAHLIPKFGPVAPSSWKSSNVLDVAPAFYVNEFSVRFMYSNIT